MVVSNFITLVEKLVNNPEVKSIEITDWKETGEYSGDDPRPIMKIEKYENIQQNNGK